MKSKYLKYNEEGKLEIRLNENCQQMLYDYFMDSYSELIVWTSNTLSELLVTFRDIDYHKVCEANFLQEYKPHLDVGDARRVLAVERVFADNHDCEEIQSVLKIFDNIIDEMLRGIET